MAKKLRLVGEDYIVLIQAMVLSALEHRYGTVEVRATRFLGNNARASTYVSYAELVRAIVELTAEAVVREYDEALPSTGKEEG